MSKLEKLHAELDAAREKMKSLAVKEKDIRAKIDAEESAQIKALMKAKNLSLDELSSIVESHSPKPRLLPKAQNDHKLQNAVNE